MTDWILNAFADEADPQVPGQIAALKRNGLAGLEVRGVNGKNVTALTLADARQLKAQLADQGLSVWSVGSPIGKVRLDEDLDAHLDLLRHTLELGQELGAKTLRMFSFYPAEGQDIAACEGQVLEQLARMVEASKGTGITLCHENEKGIFGDIAPRCLTLHRALPELRAVFDPANFIQCGQETWNAWQLLAPYVEYMHIKDALSDGSVVPAGCGEGKLPQLLAAYAAQGGNALTLEPHLTVFDGLKALEREGEASLIGKYQYPDANTAFDAAVAALKAILPQ